MSRSYIIGAPDSTGKKIETIRVDPGLTPGAPTATSVERQVITIGGLADAELLALLAAPPAGTEYSVPVRNIPSGVQASKNAQPAAPSTAAWSSATAVNQTASVALDGHASVRLSLARSGTITDGFVVFEVLTDATWIATSALRLSDMTVQPFVNLISLVNTDFLIPVAGAQQFRVRLLFTIVGLGRSRSP